MRWCRAFLAAILSVTACTGASSREPIVLGLAGPFSQPRGVSMRHAAELAVKEINAHGGIRGQPLALGIMADRGRHEVAIAIARKMTDDPSSVVVFGHLQYHASRQPATTFG